MKRARHHDPMAELLRTNLKRFREEAGLSAAAAADEAGVLVETLRRWENSSTSMDALALSKLAPVYGRDPGHFYMAEPPPMDRARREELPVFYVRVRADAEVNENLYEELLKIVATVNQKQREQSRATPVPGGKKTKKQ